MSDTGKWSGRDDKLPTDPSSDDDSFAEFLESEERVRMEKNLVRKLDMRMSILVVIYILNYVRGLLFPAVSITC